jgi:hypothetical protein
MHGVILGKSLRIWEIAATDAPGHQAHSEGSFYADHEVGQYFDQLREDYFLERYRLRLALLHDSTFELHTDAPGGLVLAVLFCSGLLLVSGAAIENAARRALRKVRSRKAGSAGGV